MPIDRDPVRRLLDQWRAIGQRTCPAHQQPAEGWSALDSQTRTLGAVFLQHADELEAALLASQHQENTEVTRVDQSTHSTRQDLPRSPQPDGSPQVQNEQPPPCSLCCGYQFYEGGVSRCSHGRTREQSFHMLSPHALACIDNDARLKAVWAVERRRTLVSHAAHDPKCESELTSHGYTPCRCAERAGICYCRKNPCICIPSQASGAVSDGVSAVDPHAEGRERGLRAHDLLSEISPARPPRQQEDE